MTWGKVDDRLHSHIKAARAGVDAMGLWVLALSWCAAYMTDGEVPAEVPARLAGKRGLALASRLVSSELWDKSEFGYRFRNWSKYQPTRAMIETQRAGAKTRMQQNRELTGDVRANTLRTNSERTANTPRTSPEVRAPFACPDPTRPEPIENTLPRPLSAPVRGAPPEGVGVSVATSPDKRAERERGVAASAGDVSSPAVTRTTRAVTSRDVSSPKVTSGDEVRRGVTSGDPMPNRTVPYQHPPTPAEGVSGSTGTAERAERERSADVEAVAARGRLVDPSLEHDAPRPNAAPQPPSVRLVLDLLNDGSEGAFALLGDSHSARQLAATVRELFESEDEIDAEAYAVLALWARERLGNGLAWAKRTGVGVKWLVAPGNLAAALGQSQGWWHRVGRNHQGELARLLGRFGLAPSALPQPAAPSPAPSVPSVVSAPSAAPASPLTPARRREILESGRRAIRAGRPIASPGDRTCAAGPEAPSVEPSAPPRGAQEPEQRPEQAPPTPASVRDESAPSWGAQAPPRTPPARVNPIDEPETNEAVA